MKLKKIDYNDLDSRQKENYNFQEISGILAHYGFATMRLSADWQDADFIAQHIDGKRFLKVQLKSRLIVDTKYKSKDIWICFRDKANNTWYLYPHDEFLKWALLNTTIKQTKGWSHTEDWDRVTGIYSWPSSSKKVRAWLTDYALAAGPA